ncbi:MAG TPA: valine--tRNA ligase [Vicinamibacterales bacterium]|nr:valine--tRNA ligase [Vicinamibacterales bacterium]
MADSPLTRLDPARLALPEKPALEGLEARWIPRWEQDGVYRFDRSHPRHEVFSIDTPPPTVSGSLHVGHVFSYTHTDLVARFQRMRGKAVFYPMGWDDNGLPTERRVQNYYGVRCDPSLPYDAAFVPPETPAKPPRSISRPNFIELCNRLTVEDEKAFEHLWKYLGLSVDWSMTYATISPRAQRVSQLAFLHLLERGLAYQVEAPTLWDVDFRTAVAQAELEDRDIAGAYHRVRFALSPEAAVSISGGAALEIETTRPELIPACVALVAHPDDPRYQPYFDHDVVTPLFGVRVPVRAHPLADPAKGTGVAMICTFGDVTDVTWWRELSLPVRAIVQADGTLRDVAWGAAGWESADPDRAQAFYRDLARLPATKARAKIVEQLKEAGDLIGEPRPITHAVKFFEKGDRPLEIVTSRQWFVKAIEFREALVERGRELRWHPPYMVARYENWTNGLNGDWCVSRQRFFGVPFPVWYPLDADKRVVYERPLRADAAALPIDPSTDVPPGYRADQRGAPGGFVGDPDVMDTWATSSLSPQIICGWPDDRDLFDRTFPMDLRPQAHDIIRTWLFDSVLRAHLEHDSLPWTDAAISGWVLDPDRKKMSKSKGNVVTPLALLEEHGSDGVRYWAASGRPGTDTAFDPNQMRVGRRLAIKVLNASRFALGAAEPQGPITAAVDRALLRSLAALVREATEAFEGYDYARALQRTETFFWRFCDDYLELVKGRRYGEQGPGGAASANSALAAALSVLLRLLAPFLPFVTEEVWSWWQSGSIHRAAWPAPGELESLLPAADEASRAADEHVYEWAVNVLFEVRKQRSEAKQPLKVPITAVSVRAAEAATRAMPMVEADLRSALRVRRFDVSVGEPGEIVVQGYEPAAAPAE